MPPRYRLKLNRLDFISAVDQPAQETAKVLLIKRRDVKGFARVAKVDEELGLVFCWAFTSTKADGSDYFDLQGDAIDQDFVKACADFMDGARAVDTMHDGKQSGRVVFAMPMTPEVAKAFGVVTKQTGLMVALRPSAEDLAKFKSGEFTGVSIAGLGEREAVKRIDKRKVRKQAVMTDEVNGHQHVIDLDDPATSWCSMYSTSYQTEEGATESHCHSWTFDETMGVITIGADSGHTHSVTDAVPADVLAAYAALDAAQDAHNAEVAAAPITEAVPTEIPVEESSGKTINVVIAARAPATKSTPAVVPNQPAHTQELPKMNLFKAIAAVLAMTASQQAYVAKLAPDDVEPFLAKPQGDRDAIMKAAAEADPIVFTGEVTKIEVRKSHGELARKMAEQNEANAVTIAKQAAELAKRDEAIEKADVRKAAIELLGGMPGDDATHDYIVHSLRKGGGDAAMIEKATATLKGMKSSSTLGKKAPGAGGDATPESGNPDEALAALEKGLFVFCKAQKIEKNLWTDGLSAFVRTPEGEALKRAYDESASS